MKKNYFWGLILVAGFGYSQTNVGITGNVGGVYINEIHYDNSNTDVGEFIEVAGPAGTDLSTYTITLYNGLDNNSYGTRVLSGVIDDEGTGVGAVSFAYPRNGIQNDIEGIALSKTGETNVQYLSYEGSMSAPANNGPAQGLSSVNINTSELASAPIGTSIEYDEITSSWINISDDTPGFFIQGPQTTLSLSQNTISGLKISPNPAKNFLRITSDNNEAKQAIIYTVLGKEVLDMKVTNTPINISDLSKGLYVVKVIEEGKTSTRKLIIE